MVAENKLGKDEEKIIRERIESQLGKMEIHVEQVTSIPLNNNGKFQAVISKIKRMMLRYS